MARRGHAHHTHHAHHHHIAHHAHRGAGRHARLLAPEWVAYDNSCRGYLNSLTLPPAASRIYPTVIFLGLLNLILTVCVIATPYFNVSGNMALALAVVNIAWSITDAGDLSGDLSISLSSLSSCPSLRPVFCSLSVGGLGWGSEAWMSALSGGLAMFVLALILCIAAAVAGMIGLKCCPRGSAGMVDPWRLRPALATLVLYSAALLLQLIGVLVVTTGFTTRFVASHSSLITKESLTAGPAFAIAIVTIIISAALVVLLFIHRRILLAHNKAYEFPPAPVVPTGPRYADEVLLQAMQQLAMQQQQLDGVPPQPQMAILASLGLQGYPVPSVPATAAPGSFSAGGYGEKVPAAYAEAAQAHPQPSAPRAPDNDPSEGLPPMPVPVAYGNPYNHATYNVAL